MYIPHVLIHKSQSKVINMGNMNAKINRAVWFDIPVLNLDRASDFYGAVLNIKIHREKYDDFVFWIMKTVMADV